MDRQGSGTQALATDRIQIAPYRPADREQWDAFVTASRNGTFLFLRAYMDYLGSAVEDRSLLIRDGQGRLMALLPGNIEGSTYLSHGRLTYGGFLLADSTRLPAVVQMFDATLTWLKENGIESFLYKTVPHIYHRVPSEEDRYALALAGATWIRSGMLAVVRPAVRLPYQERRRRALKKAKERGLTVGLSGDLPAYWGLLTQVLWERYQTAPVHTLEQIQTLQSAFPDNIHLYACYEGSEMLAGVLIYESAHVARAQYIASGGAGRAAGALDSIIHYLITNRYTDKSAIDLGTSDEQAGKVLNVGLMEQKEGFGARAVALDQYMIDVTRWCPGTLVSALQ